jgi:hypothetical protein
MPESICRGCQKKIIWITTPDGKRVPLDPVPAIYEVDPVNPTIGERTKSAMVSHFATCPNASDFSGKNR